MIETTNDGFDAMLSIEESLEELFEVYDEFDDSPEWEEAEEGINNFGLEWVHEDDIDPETGYFVSRYVFGTGGPHTEARVYSDFDGDLRFVEFVYYTWFGQDMFERTMDSSSAIYRLVADALECSPHPREIY